MIGRKKEKMFKRVYTLHTTIVKSITGINMHMYKIKMIVLIV